MATKEQINLFLSDPDYLSLIELEREQRLLFITGTSETKVSAFLAWIFRPNEGHGLGDQAIRELLLHAWRRNENDEWGIDGLPTPKQLFESTYRDLLVETEYQVDASKSGKGKGRAVDLLLLSRRNKLLIAIENKFGSKVHSNQLSSYRSALEKSFPDYKHVFIYLDSNEDNSPDDGQWVQLDYKWLISMIGARQKSGLLSERALDALSQFKTYLSQDGAVSEADENEKEQLVEAMAIKHNAVLSVFQQFQMEGWTDRLRDSTPTILEPLIVEYHQRWSLWRDVLATSRHAPLIAEVRKVFAQELEVSTTGAAVYFRLREWARFDGASDDDWWGAYVSAWCGKEQASTYDVLAAINFANVRPEHEPKLRQTVIALRDVKLKAAPRAAQWVRISRQDELKPLVAAHRVIGEIKRIDSELKKLS